MLLLEYKPVKKAHKSTLKFNLQGQKIGKYFVYKKDNNKYGNWLCTCDCGNNLSIRGCRLVKNERDFCGCEKKKNNVQKRNLQKVCLRCAKIYEMSPKAKHSKYCCKACYKNWKQECKSCGKKIEVTKGPENQYCSLQCKIKNHYIIVENGCWIWINVNENAHGSQISFKGKKYSYKQISYIANKGLIPKGSVITRKCKNFKCINPDHHEILSREEFFKTTSHNRVTKNINKYIVRKIIELYELGLSDEEIVLHYKYEFKHKSFRSTSSFC